MLVGRREQTDIVSSDLLRVLGMWAEATGGLGSHSSVSQQQVYFDIFELIICFSSRLSYVNEEVSMHAVL